MELTKYQWFQEQPTSECGFCDRLLKFPNTGEIGDTVQVSVDTGNEFTEAFNENPFAQLDDTEITFKVTEPLPYGTVQIYINSNIYIFTIADTLGLDHYSLVSNTGNFYYYVVYADQILPGYSLEENMLAFLVEVIDANNSTISTYDSMTGIFEIANIFNPVYFNVENNVLNTVTGTSSVSSESYYMYYNAGSICMYGVPGGENPYFTEYIPLLSYGIDYILKIPYTASYVNYEYLITITDGVNTLTTTGTLTNLNGEISYNFTAPSTDSYTITFELTERNDTTEGLCINGMTVDYINSVTSVEIEDCNGNITEADYSVNYYGDKAIIRMDNANYYESTLPTVFRFKIEDQNNNTIVSRWYELYDEDNCEHQKYTKITWSNSCNLGELLYDYSLLNELYFSGVLIKQGLEVHDSADNVTADGRKISIFKITQPSYELRLAPYLSETMDMIERIFEHDTVLINGVQYNTTDSFQVSELDMGVYTGRVDLLKSDDSLVSIKCCS